jgi:hypothetical protein
MTPTALKIIEQLLSKDFQSYKNQAEKNRIIADLYSAKHFDASDLYSTIGGIVTKYRESPETIEHLKALFYEKSYFLPAEKIWIQYDNVSGVLVSDKKQKNHNERFDFQYILIDDGNSEIATADDTPTWAKWGLFLDKVFINYNGEDHYRDPGYECFLPSLGISFHQQASRIHAFKKNESASHPYSARAKT